MKAQWTSALSALFAALHAFVGAKPTDGGHTVIQSPIDPGIILAYKRVPPGICATVSPHQKQYTGYVSLPPSTLHPVAQNYTINTFFWFVEAREKPTSAPLTLYLSGGPGVSSMQGMFQETGPCEVVERSETKLGTIPREWSWDRSSNMLYIDQPVQVGFSYDTLKEASLDFLTSTFTSPPTDSPAGQSPETFRRGVFSSNDAAATASTTGTAARAIWHMLQVFLIAFPEYKHRREVAEVNLFTESYGGKYGPAFASHFHRQNERRRRGEIPKQRSVEIKVKTLGIMQGCIDDLVQNLHYALFAYNNTYGERAISSEDVKAFQQNFYRPGGCRDKVHACRAAVRSLDPENVGNVSSVNTACYDATGTCNLEVIQIYPKIGRSSYDIAQNVLNPLPPSTYLEYLNAPEVQRAIGAPLNFTQSSSTVFNAFLQAGDYVRGDYIADLASLLDHGVRIALIYGDRDFICNWFGGQAASFAVAAASNSSPSYLANYNAAGYAPLLVNSSYTGGVVRQFANLSFARIYDAGHFVPSYQPETLFQLFTRIIEGKNPSTGKPIPDLARFRTEGDANATATNSLPAPAKPTCYLRLAPDTCSSEQMGKMKAGKGRFVNGVWYER
ncbi:serine-type carboxypeptidase [Emydomyces testavorans]|uniref:Carboxypeptidase n=1 Tax=Emydomyces testavorans TaxID=2070801 RepID=A0AAF0DGW6_9EURO|nr:serine-type carboxypeptidase [Emydomyces testavorans]